MQENKQEKSLIKQNILLYLENKGVTPYEFYKVSGVTRGILQQNNGISEDNIARFLAYAKDVNIVWLLTGTGGMLTDDIVKDKDSHYKSQVPTAKHSDDPPKGLPLIPIEALAGFPANDEAGVRFDDCERYSIPEFEERGAEFLIRVSGTSMIPLYYNGDILACKKINNIRFFQWGTVYVLDSSQGPLVKRVFEAEDEQCVSCVSENKDNFPPFSLPKSDIRSLSIIVGLVRIE